MDELLKYEIEKFASGNAELIRKNWGTNGAAIYGLLKGFAGVVDKEQGSTHFDAFWAAYPPGKRKVDKAGCRRIWRSRCLDNDAGEILAGLLMLKRDDDWTKDGGSWVPMPAVFLNQRRWEGIISAPTHSIFDGAR